MTLLLDTLFWHFCLTLLLDTLAGHSCLTLLLDTLAWHFCWTLLTGHSCLTLLLDIFAGHSWQDTLAWHSFLTLFLDTLVWHFCLTLLLDTLSWHSCLTRLFHETFPQNDNPSFQNERFTRDFHQKWQSKLPKRAFSTRLSPRVTIQASKTSVLHETSRKSEFRNKRSASQIPMEQRDSTPLKHHSETANPNITATQTSHFHETLRLCSEITFFNLQVYNVLRLPRKMSFVTFLKTCKIVTFPSVWNDFDHFCSHTLTAKSTFYLRLVTKTELFKPPCNCKSQWNSAIQHL